MGIRVVQGPTKDNGSVSSINFRLPKRIRSSVCTFPGGCRTDGARLGFVGSLGRGNPDSRDLNGSIHEK